MFSIYCLMCSKPEISFDFWFLYSFDIFPLFKKKTISWFVSLCMLLAGIVYRPKPSSSSLPLPPSSFIPKKNKYICNLKFTNRNFCVAHQLSTVEILQQSKIYNLRSKIGKIF